jgi:hypothetical protein
MKTLGDFAVGAAAKEKIGLKTEIKKWWDEHLFATSKLSKNKHHVNTLNFKPTP